MNTFIDYDGSVYSSKANGNTLTAIRTHKGQSTTKTVRVEESEDFVYSVLKTKIKARGGAEGLQKFLEERQTWQDFGAAWNRCIYTAIFNTVKEARTK